MIRELVYFILMLLLLICLINYGVDACFYLKNRYCRFHIGRWKDRDIWEKAVEKRAFAWLKKTPTVKITDNSRYMLLDFATGKYKSDTIQSWQKGALILGLLNSKNNNYRDAAKKAALDMLDENYQWRKPPVAVDCGMLSYAVLLASDDPIKVKPAMDYSIDIIRKNINDEGMVSYTGGKDNPNMYVDALGLVCPFLALYAKCYDAPEYETIALHQLEIFHQYGLYKDTSLPNHAFDIKTKLPLGVYGWGRGTGWYAIGLVDTYMHLQNQRNLSICKLLIQETAECYSKFQRPDGGFGSILQLQNSYDSSTTAVFAWFFGRCGNIFSKDEYKKIADKCLLMLLKNTRITGAIDWCQGDTKGIGIFAQTYDVMPFAQGMALRAMREMSDRNYGEKNKD